MINFFTEGVDFVRDDYSKLKDWLRKVIVNEKFTIDYINYIFCDDNYLSEMNKKYLNHKDLTDIITFQFNEKKTKKIEAEIYISVERVAENAVKYNEDFDNEFKRVLVHGVLHLVGYNDKTKEEKRKMRLMEDYYLRK